MAGADDMVEQAFDPTKQDVVARAIEQLSPEEAGFFLDKLERAIRKRKIQFTGYLVAMVVWLFGMVFALFYYGAAAEGEFVGWVFVMPFAAVGVILTLFGRWGDRVGKAPPRPAAIAAPGDGDKAKLVGKPPASAKSAKPAPGPK